MNNDDLARQVRELADRLNRLEAAAPVQEGQRRDAAVVGQLIPGLDDESLDRATGVVVYAGAGPWEDGTIAWKMDHPWEEVRGLVGDGTARVLAALGSTVRLRIVAALLNGPVATGELADRLDQPTSGQLFHHLKELLGSGLIHQPVRGTYALRRQDVIPLLAVIAAAVDLAGPGGSQEPS